MKRLIFLFFAFVAILAGLSSCRTPEYTRHDPYSYDPAAGYVDYKVWLDHYHDPIPMPRRTVYVNRPDLYDYNVNHCSKCERKGRLCKKHKYQQQYYPYPTP